MVRIQAQLAALIREGVDLVVHRVAAPDHERQRQAPARSSRRRAVSLDGVRSGSGARPLPYGRVRRMTVFVDTSARYSSTTT